MSGTWKVHKLTTAFLSNFRGEKRHQGCTLLNDLTFVTPTNNCSFESLCKAHRRKSLIRIKLEVKRTIKSIVGVSTYKCQKMCGLGVIRKFLISDCTNPSEEVKYNTALF